ncbi:MAG: 3-deoxy-manno-octulosonate cytidylyltransferase [Paracoccaceae bacterium]|nr:3-deoxy-manno-octulosonate cytidylyltransferase [Paracoccaceae bacterium]MDE2913274.1 3-deoxy-manno-octulosonate cytidylyltransferase [Paracoccaceae bacterium]
MSVIVIIPARYQSTRFPGKALVELRGFDGTPRSLIRRTWDAASDVRGVDTVHVATDDRRIADHVEAFGAHVVLTSPACRNGTERCAEALALLDPDAQAAIIVNIQGDAPLVPRRFVEALIGVLKADPSAGVATPVLRCDPVTLDALREDRRHGRVGATTAVFDHSMNALYFSKEIVPAVGPVDRSDAATTDVPPVYHHLGVYAYRRQALLAYVGWPEGPLESAEGLEQLRFLENGESIRCVDVDSGGRIIPELNNPIDVARIEAVLRAEGRP